MDPHHLTRLAMHLHNRLGRHAYMVGVRDVDKPKLIVYVIKGQQIPPKTIPTEYEGVAVEVMRLEPMRAAS